MYVCLCAQVTDSDIRQAVREGCCSVRDLRDRLGVAAGCGKCAEMAQELIKETLAEMPVPASDKAA